MWYLEGFRATNFQTFKDIEYCIEQGVTTLVFGENLDNPIQKSNGSGKSTIGEIIVVGTRGTPMKNVRIDEIINNNENKATTEVVYRNSQTNELMIITRELYKKSSNTVSLYMEKDNEPIAPELYTQASASDYCDFIFKTLGITEEEFLNNFVISKHRYVSFLDSNDKTKKEIINKLSNVDKIMNPTHDLLNIDIEHYTKEVDRVHHELSSVSGAAEALEKQVAKLQEKAGSESKKEKENLIKGQITKYESELFDLNESLKTYNSEKAAIIKADEIVGAIKEEWDIDQMRTFLSSSVDKDSHPVTYQTIISCINEIDLKIHTIDSYNKEIDGKKKDLVQFSTDIEKLNKKLSDEKSKVNEINSHILEAQSKTDTLKDSIQVQYHELTNEYENLNSKISDNQKKIAIFEKEIGKLNNILAGKITCPKCSYEFLLDNDVTLDEAKDKLEVQSNGKTTVETNLSELKNKADLVVESISETSRKKIDLENELQEQINQIRAKLPEINKVISSIEKDIQECNNKVNVTKSAISNLNSSITNINNNLLSTIDNIVLSRHSVLTEAIKDIEQKITYKKQAIQTSKEGLAQLLESTIEDNIVSLKSDIIVYKEKQSKINKEYDKLSNKLDDLNKQKVIFNNFKTYLANTKIEALSQEINNFLKNTGSDIRVELSGYTKTKSGDVRQKISISIIRNGINFGSYGKLSEGEKATTQVATILAQLKLININAPSNKGLNLLVIDEILDMIDTKGLSRIFNVLNKEGITSLIVSHGMINENYAHKVLVRKKQGISSIIGL